MKHPCQKSFVALALMSLAVTAFAASYYVSPTGSDRAVGSETQPFATVQYAVDRLNPGDVLALRAGTYHETVTVSRSGTAEAPITIQAYTGEVPLLSGARPVGGPWTVHAGSIRRTAWPTQPVQVFCDGSLLNEARWPNTPLPDDIREQASALTDVGSANSITCKALPPVDLTGAWLHIMAGQAWVGYSRQIATHDQATGLLGYTSPISQMTELIPRGHNRFFVFGKLELLDAPGEWWWDPVGKQLYVWTPDGAAPDGRVEAGEASAVLDLSGQSCVTVKGLAARGGWFNLKNCTACRAENCRLYAPTWLRTFDGFAIWPTSVLGGIDVSGTGNVVQGGSVRLAGRSGVHLAGSDNTLREMLIEDCGWNWTNNAAVDLHGSTRSLVENCTLRRMAGTGLVLAPASQVLRNRVESAALAFEDCGNINAWSMDGLNTEVAYNLVHGNNSRWGAGIYLDAGCRNFWVHDNYVDDVKWGGINITGPLRVENNTFVGMQHQGIAQVPQSSTDGVDMSAGLVAHNLTAEPFPIDVSLVQPVSLVPEWAGFGSSAPLAPLGVGPRRVELLWSQMTQPGWSLQEVPMDLSVVYALTFTFESPAVAYSYTVSNVRFLPVGGTDDAGAVPVTGATAETTGSGGSTCMLNTLGPTAWNVTGTNPFRGLNSLSVSLPGSLANLTAFRGVAFELAGTATRNYQFQGYQDIDNGPDAVPGRGARLPADIGAPSADTITPVITAQPLSLTVMAGNSATFIAAASGTPAPAFQWQKDGVAIGGATAASYAIAHVSAGDAGRYTVVATNSAGTATSNAAILTVNASPTPTPTPTPPAQSGGGGGGGAIGEWFVAGLGALFLTRKNGAKIYLAAAARFKTFRNI